MGLNISKGNMYSFVTHTWNTVKGECFHNCSYCYMKRWGKQKPPHFDAKELKTDLGVDNFIFVGSGIDMFAQNIPEKWIIDTLDYLGRFTNNKYLFQTKNPERFKYFIDHKVIRYQKVVLCTTLESDSYYPEIMNQSPTPMERSIAMNELSGIIDTYVTIEPIIEFHLEHFVNMIRRCNPIQVNIGCDSGRNDLPEPSKEKVLQLIEELQKFTTIHNKSNLKRLLI